MGCRQSQLRGDTLAARLGKAEGEAATALLRRFVDSGLDVNAADATLGQTPLAAAVRLGLPLEGLEVLLKAGARPSGVDDQEGGSSGSSHRCTPDIVIFQQLQDRVATTVAPNCREVVKLMVKWGLDVNILSPSTGESLLLASLKAGEAGLAEDLLTAGAQATATDAAGNSPLHVAAAIGAYPVAEMLLKQGADVRAKNADGHSPVMCARLGSVAPGLRLSADWGWAAKETLECKEWNEKENMMLEKGEEVWRCPVTKVLSSQPSTPPTFPGNHQVAAKLALAACDAYSLADAVEGAWLAGEAPPMKPMQQVSPDVIRAIQKLVEVLQEELRAGMEARDRARISAGLEMLRYAKVAQMPEEEPATRTLVGLELQAAIDSSCELELKQALMSAQQYDRTSSPLYKRAREVLDAILEQKRVDQIARQLGEASSRGDLATVHALLQAGARTSGPLEKFAERPEFAQAQALLAKSVRQSLQKAVATCDRKAARQACSEAVRYGLCELPEYKRLVDLRKQLVLQNIEEAAARKEQENLRAKLQEAIEDPDLELEHLREEPGFRGGLKVYRDLLSLPPYFEDEQVLESVSKRHSVKREELLSDALCQAFQELMDKTYRKVRTKDRRGEIPKRLLVKEVLVVKNSSNFVEYLRRREEIRQQLETDKGVPPSVVVNDLNGTQACKTLANLARGQPFHSVWRDAQGVSADPIDTKINEFYLFHGTGPEAATAITEGDFRMDLAGSNAGTLYGRGIYFSESTGKSDEYSRQDSRGLCPVLVCRVTLGRILYTDEEYPDTRQLVRSCVAGNTHSVLGDREKIRNTFRELIVFDSDQAYPEFIVWYAREF